MLTSSTLILIGLCSTAVVFSQIIKPIIGIPNIGMSMISIKCTRRLLLENDQYIAVMSLLTNEGKRLIEEMAIAFKSSLI